MAVDIFAITEERRKLDSCDFHHSTEDRREHPSKLTVIGQYIDQSDGFFMGIIKTKF
jgi:hypothetical protein